MDKKFVKYLNMQIKKYEDVLAELSSEKDDKMKHELFIGYSARLYMINEIKEEYLRILINEIDS